MKLWCGNCQTAVEPEVKREKEFHGEVDSRFYEEYDVYSCPICGDEVFDTPGTCALCGEPCAPDEELCDSCNGVIRTRIATMAADLGVTVSIMTEALADYLAEE